MAASYMDTLIGMTDYAKSTKLDYVIMPSDRHTIFNIGKRLVVRVGDGGGGGSSTIRLLAPVVTSMMEFVDVPHAIKWVAGLWEKHRPKQTQAVLNLPDPDEYRVNAAWKVIQADNRTLRAIVHRKGNAIFASANAGNEAVSIDPDGRIYTRRAGRTEYVSPAPVGTEAITQWFLTLVDGMSRHDRPGNIIQLPRTCAPRIYADPPSVRMTGPPLIKLEVADVV